MREVVKTRLNLEMAATEEMVKTALKYRPDMVTLVPEKREEVTTEGGLDVAGNMKKIRNVTTTLQKDDIPVSLFIEGTKSQIDATKETEAIYIELHTGKYANQKKEKERLRELSTLAKMADYARSMGLRVNAGHGLNYRNVQPVAALPGMEELNIGHSIIAHSMFVGIERAVREMVELIEAAQSTS